MVSLRSIIRTLPMVARGGMLAHSPSLHLGFASTSLLRPRSLWSHGLLSGVASLQYKTHAVSLTLQMKSYKDLLYHSY